MTIEVEPFAPFVAFGLPFLGFIAFAIVMVFVAIKAGEAAKKAAAARQAALAAWASARGLGYRPGDFGGYVPTFREAFLEGKATEEAGWIARLHHFAFFKLGHSQSVDDLMWGHVDGMDLHLFDYSYKITTSTGKTTTTVTYPFTVIEAILPLDLPPLQLAPEVWGQSFFSGKDVQFESAEFNRAWRVEGDPRWAHDVIHPRTMEFLMASGSLRWSFGGPQIIVIATGKSTPERYDAMLSELQTMVDLMPDYVKKDRTRR